MRFDVLANFVAVLVRHDDVGDHDVRPGGFDLRQRRCRIMTSHDIDVLSTEGDLDHLAHGRTVINEVDSGNRAHQKPPSALPWAASSSSRSASSMSSVAERSTVRVAALSPGRNLYDPASRPLQHFTMCTTASSPMRSPLSA